MAFQSARFSEMEDANPDQRPATQVRVRERDAGVGKEGVTERLRRVRRGVNQSSASLGYHDQLAPQCIH
jgi:hypothetical protein